MTFRFRLFFDCARLTVLAVLLLVHHAACENQLPNIGSRQTVSGDGYGGIGYTVLPILRDETPATIILLHGLGGTGEEWGYISLALSFFSLNFVKFIIPTADTQPVTYLAQTVPSWYDITTLRDFITNVNEVQMQQSVDRINRIVAGEILAGVASERIFLIGFSQGGGLALTTFLRSPSPLGGCIGVATWLPLVNQYPQRLSEQIQNQQVLLMHGTEDEVVPISLANSARNNINRFGAPVNLTTNLTRLEGEGHVIVNPLVMDAIEEYVIARATGTSMFLVKLVDDLANTFAGLNGQVARVALPDVK